MLLQVSHCHNQPASVSMGELVNAVSIRANIGLKDTAASSQCVNSSYGLVI